MKSNALYIQSGGPTAVINSSAYGVITECWKNADKIGTLFAAEQGLAGVISGKLFDLSVEDGEQIGLLRQTPSMAFGSCRHMVSDEDCYKILNTLQKYNIHYIFMNGGNGSVRGCLQIHEYLTKAQYDFKMIEIPKTIDNDISNIDHTPGYPSAARHLVIEISELVHDMLVYDTDQIMVAEVMGRNSGYLAAATLAAGVTGYGPDLIYVPETAFSEEGFLADIAEVVAQKGKCFVTVAEGVKTASGEYLSEKATAHHSDRQAPIMGGVTPYLRDLLQKHFSCKIRCVDMGLMQRCAAHDISDIDRDEATLLGSAAVTAELEGTSGKMMAIRRVSNHPYQIELAPVDLNAVAAFDNSLPLQYINEKHNGICLSFLDYILPLIGELPKYASLRKIIAKA